MVLPLLVLKNIWYYDVLMVKFLPLQMTLQWSLSALLWLPWREIVIVPFVDDTAQNAFAAVLLWSRTA